MNAIRSALVPVLALSLTACATAPARTTPPASAARVVASAKAIDTAAVRDAARRLGARPAFGACVDAAAGAGLATHGCIEAELRFQESRLQAAVAARRGPASNGDPDAVQAQWLAERDHLCGADNAGAAIAERVAAGLCRLEATVARADVLAR